jgi:hypothetical protein
MYNLIMCYPVLTTTSPPSKMEAGAAAHSSRPANAANPFHSWKRLRQKLLWELRDEADTEDSFHYLTVPLPPRVDGFPGFSLNGFKGAVIGFVIQVSKSNFSVREWNIKLEHPMAKVSYALIRDHLGRVQAFSLTTFHPLQVIGGLSPAVFNMAGFPVDMGSPTTAESLGHGDTQVYTFLPTTLFSTCATLGLEI